jgi:Ca2+/H+ antiporter
MNILESLMAGSFAGLLIMFYYIKIILKTRGYKIHLFYNHGQDYQNFKQLIENEKDFKKKQSYQGIRLLLILFACSLIASAVVGVIST